MPVRTDEEGAAYIIAPDLDRDVQVATAVDLEPREPLPGVVPDRDVFCLRPYGAEVALVLALAVVAGVVISSLTPIPAWLVIIVVLVALVLVVIFSPSARSMISVTRALGLATVPSRGVSQTIPEDARLNPAFRVRLRVEPGRATEVGPIVDGPFEPQVHHAAFAIHNPVGVYMWGFVALLGALCWTAWWMLGRGLLPALPMATYHFYFVIAVMSAIAPFYVLFPTYYRVSPGLLEVLRYRPLLAGKPRIQKIDLRRARVLVDLVNARLVIEEMVPDRRGGQPRSRTTRLDMGPEWAMDHIEFARHILAAARWRGEFGPVAQEGLSG